MAEEHPKPRQKGLGYWWPVLVPVGILVIILVGALAVADGDGGFKVDEERRRTGSDITDLSPQPEGKPQRLCGVLSIEGLDNPDPVGSMINRWLVRRGNKYGFEVVEVALLNAAADETVTEPAERLADVVAESDGKADPVFSTPEVRADIDTMNAWAREHCDREASNPFGDQPTGNKGGIR